jgi:uncharacterized protein (TIGR03000 family)
MSAYGAEPSGGVVQQPADPRSATLVVTLPEDAKLTIDGHATISTSGERVFTTPPLEEGKEFHYTLKAQVVRDGHTQSIVQEVTIRSGETAEVTLAEPVSAAAE